MSSAARDYFKEYYILRMARFLTRQKTPSARVAAQPSATGRNVRVRRNPVRLQSPRTPIPPHSDSVVSYVAPSVSSAAALNVAPDPGAATQTSAAGSNACARPTPVRRQPTGTPLSSFAASVVSDIAPSVSYAAAFSVTPDVLASAVS